MVVPAGALERAGRRKPGNTPHAPLSLSGRPARFYACLSTKTSSSLSDEITFLASEGKKRRTMRRGKMSMGGSANASVSSWVMREVRIGRDVVVEGGRAVWTGLYMIDGVGSARRRSGRWGCTWSCGRRCACGVDLSFCWIFLEIKQMNAIRRVCACVSLMLVDECACSWNGYG